MDPNTDGKLPLGVLRQAVMKLDAFNTDIMEILEDEDLQEEDRALFRQMSEYAGIMMANIVNVVSRECGEEEFFAEQPDMDEIEAYPGVESDSHDIMEEEL